MILIQFCFYYSSLYFDTFFIVVEAVIISWCVNPYRQVADDFAVRFPIQILAILFVIPLFFFVSWWEAYFFNEVWSALQRHNSFADIVQNSEEGLLVLSKKSKGRTFSVNMFQNKFVKDMTKRV